VIDQHGPGHEAHRAVHSTREQGGSARRGIELVADATSGEGVEAQLGELRVQAQQAVKSPRSRLVGADLLGAGKVAGRGQGYGDGAAARLAGILAGSAQA